VVRFRELSFVAALGVMGCGGESSSGRPMNGPSGGCGSTAPCAAAGGEGATDGGSAGGGAAGQACSEEAETAPPLWATWPMPNPPSTGLPNPASYEVGNDTVLDHITGLMWQRSTSAELTFEQAVSYCAELELDGHCGFRVPTRIELVSLVDFTRGSPAFEPAMFPETEGSLLSASSGAGGYRWHIGADGGTRAYTEKQAPTGRVRCVRRHVEQALPNPHYVIVGQDPDDTVIDQGTGLVWQRRVSRSTYTFDEARAYCESLALDGGGFRVPSMKELQTLVDETRASGPLIDTEAFPGLPEDEAPTFWTSSLSAHSPNAAWFVRGAVALDVGIDLSLDAKYSVRCVR
jgi:hypothetical protein